MRFPCPLQSHTGEEKAPSCSQKTGILLTLRNIGVHQAVTFENNGKCASVFLYICLWGKSSRAENHVPMFVCCIALAWFLVSQGTFRSLWVIAQWFERDKNVNICYHLLFYGHSGILASQPSKMGHGYCWFILWLPLVCLSDGCREEAECCVILLTRR